MIRGVIKRTVRRVPNDQGTMIMKILKMMVVVVMVIYCFHSTIVPTLGGKKLLEKFPMNVLRDGFVS